MTLKWKSNVANKTKLVPLVAYNRTTLTLNGESLNATKLKRNSVGALYVSEKKGVNKLTVGYKPLMQTNIGAAVSIIGWLATIMIPLGYTIKNKFL